MRRAKGSLLNSNAGSWVEEAAIIPCWCMKWRDLAEVLLHYSLINMDDLVQRFGRAALVRRRTA
jgi:hypothetical protein